MEKWKIEEIVAIIAVSLTIHEWMLNNQAIIIMEDIFASCYLYYNS